MYASIRRYNVSAGMSSELIQRVNDEFVPIISQAPGFISYYVVDAGDDVVATVSVFEDQAGAEESNRMAADWVKQSIAQHVSGPPQIIAGEVPIHRTSHAVAG